MNPSNDQQWQMRSQNIKDDAKFWAHSKIVIMQLFKQQLHCKKQKQERRDLSQVGNQDSILNLKF